MQRLRYVGENMNKPCEHDYQCISATRDKWTYKCTKCGAIYEQIQYEEYERWVGRG